MGANLVLQLGIPVYSFSRRDGWKIVSLRHFHITQVVNTPMKGVHGLLPKPILPRPALL